MMLLRGARVSSGRSQERRPCATARILAVAFLALAASNLGLPSAVASVRTEPLDANYLTFVLAWRDGKGFLDSGGPGPSEDDVAFSKGRWYEFESLPIPRTYYVNVSRVIQLNLFQVPVQGISQNDRLEIRVGDRLMAGATVAGSIAWCPPAGGTGCADSSLRPEAARYEVLAYRLQAEEDTIEKGSILRIKVACSASDCKMGFRDEHSSLLHIPVFSPDEVVYRVSKFAGKASLPLGADAPVRSVLESLLGGLHLAALALATLSFARPRRGVTSVLLAALLASTVLGGCLREDGAPEASAEPTNGLGGKATTYFVEDTENQTGLANSSRGSVFGVVFDPDRYPINGAHVALLGTPNFATTTAYGRFQFVGLAPGPYVIRIDREGFRSWEETVEVKGGGITKVEVALEWTDTKSRDLRPHRHDYWYDPRTGQPVESFEIVNRTLSSFCSSDSNLLGYTLSLLLPTSCRTNNFVLPPPVVILPGTRDVEINMTWDGTAEGDLQLRAPNDLYNATTLYARPSGVSYHFRTTWEMTDPGHSPYSFWSAFSPGAYVSPCTVAEQLSCDREASTRVRITIHKGVVPLEPPHPDRWSGLHESIVVDNQEGVLKRNCAGLSTVILCPVQLPATVPEAVAKSQDPYSMIIAKRAYNATWHPSGFVPFEADRLLVTLSASRAFAESSGDEPYALWFRDARTPTYGDCAAQATQNIEASRTIRPLQRSTTKWTWEIPLQPGATDPPYARFTNWCFYVAPVDPEAFALDDHASQGDLPVLTLNVAAQRDTSEG